MDSQCAGDVKCVNKLWYNYTISLNQAHVRIFMPGTVKLMQVISN